MSKPEDAVSPADDAEGAGRSRNVTLRRAPASASFWPKEHGAYAQLGLPLASALCLARPSASAGALGAAALCGFLAHEPLLVRLGRRGQKRRREDGLAASRRLVVLVVLGALAAAIGLHGADVRLLAACAAVAAGVAITAWLVSAKREKTLLGELAIAATLSSASIPVALASQVRVQSAILLALAWWWVSVLGTFTVHAMLQRHKTASRSLGRATWALALATLLGVALATLSRGTWALGLVPPVAVTLAVLGLGVTPRQLRRVGWSMVVAQLVALLIFVFGLRAGSA